MTKSKRTLEWRTNNAFDTVLLLSPENIVIGEWQVTPDIAEQWLASSCESHIEFWEPSHPYISVPDAYGERVEGDVLAERIHFHAAKGEKS